MPESKPMMKVWLKPMDKSSQVKSMKLTLVSPPWPAVGGEVNYLGGKWKVVKTSATKGVVL
jgi:hypothetical protein